MDKSTLKMFLVIAAIIGTIVFAVYSLQNGASSTSYSRAEITSIVEQYIQENPQALVQSLNNYQRTEQSRLEEKAQAAVKDHLDALENDPKSPFVGNPDAKVTVVEFFDYSCGYCKRAFKTLQKVIEEHKDVKVVFKEYPILGPNSTLGAKAALAVYNTAPEKYLDFHGAAMEERITGKASIQKIVNKLGLDWKLIETKMESAEVNTQIQKNIELTDLLGIRGTPAFVVGGKLFRGAVGYDQIEQAIADAK